MKPKLIARCRNHSQPQNDCENCVAAHNTLSQRLYRAMWRISCEPRRVRDAVALTVELAFIADGGLPFPPPPLS